MVCMSLPVYLLHAIQLYPQHHLCNPVRKTFAMVAIAAVPAWRPMPLSALMQESVLTGGITPMGSVVRYIVLQSPTIISLLRFLSHINISPFYRTQVSNWKSVQGLWPCCRAYMQ